ncbi:MAG: M20 family metallopeptidase [Actinobacteria bacterium]|nr:M20 family metallopeptidase [Actinomycetota bacterium]
MEAKDLEEIAARRYDDFVHALREMVNVDCGSYTPEGVNMIADLCQARFEAGGWQVERRHHQSATGEQQLGDLVIGRLAGAGGGRVLMIGHTDTVFDPGTVAERPFAIDGDRARGPGVSDMKGGLLTGFFAVEVLQAAGFDGFGRITYICNPDEEIGSPWSRDVILAQAAEADVGFVLEGARENGDIVSARKGVADLRIEIVGRAAHAGVEPERGRSAILEAAHKTQALHALNGRVPGVTVNVGVVSGGTRPNVVAERCVLDIDVRSTEERSFREAEEAVRAIAHEHTVPDVSAIIDGSAWHRPMEKGEGGARLAALATQVAAELGFELKDASTGGASDANTTSAAGVPTLDGLGPIGGDDHGPNEWLDLSSVVPRISLLAGLISRVDAAR